ncbi:CoA-binding protein [bacterium]|nr:CoA-binding protein [bacterium]
MSIEQHELDPLFFPESVAVIGATQQSNSFLWGGNSYIEGSVKQCFRGRIYPVNPKLDSVLGYKTYKSVLDIPDKVDLAIFSIPQKAVIQVMKECVEKKVKFVHLFTAGFSETGKEQHITSRWCKRGDNRRSWWWKCNNDRYGGKSGIESSPSFTKLNKTPGRDRPF